MSQASQNADNATPQHRGGFFVPDFPLPAKVRALQTTRVGGVSAAPWASFNLGNHVGDDCSAVARNRQILATQLPADVPWLSQVHGTHAVHHSGTMAGISEVLGTEADAMWSNTPNAVCAVMTADCLPLLLCDREGQVVAAVHAGWRGLCAGVIEHTIACLPVPAKNLLAWRGPAIGPCCFEVGAEVRAAFIKHDAAAIVAFKPSPGKENSGAWLADLYQLAAQRLLAAGVLEQAIYGAPQCTVCQADRYFSHRRDRVSGRQASLIWLTH